MPRRQTFLISFASILLSIAGAFALRSVFAQAGPRPCSEGCGGLACVSGLCNVPPPIWNIRGTGLEASGQDARIFLQGSSVENSARFGNLQIGLGNQINNLLGGEVAINYLASTSASVGRGFTIYNGNIDPWFRIDNTGRISIANDLLVTGKIQGNFVDSSGGECADGKILKRSGTNWICANDSMDGGSGGGGSGAEYNPCTHNIFQRFSDEPSTGSAGGYIGANGRCLPGQHVCTVEEILHSINCGRILLTQAGRGWISGGPPGYTAPANDCQGWTSTSASGRVWDFEAAGQGTGGSGTLTSCSAFLQFACCLN